MTVDPYSFANTMLNSNPNIASNPNMQQMVNAIRNNDAESGRRIAQNICATYGLTEDQAISMARKFFHM